MKADDWAAIAAVAQIVAALAAVSALVFVGRQVRDAARSADLQSLQIFLKDATEREHAFASATSEQMLEKAFYEFMNFLEVYAAAINDGRLQKTSHRLVEEKLLDSLVEIQLSSSHWAAKIEQAFSSFTTFRELHSFIANRQIEFNNRVRDRQAVSNMSDPSVS